MGGLLSWFGSIIHLPTKALPLMATNVTTIVDSRMVNYDLNYCYQLSAGMVSCCR
jgi:hypothetical protein